VADYWNSIEKTKYTDNTILDQSSLKKELQTVRRQGYAVDNEEMEIGVRCVASAIRQHRSGILAAVSVSGPSTRLTADRVSSLGELVRQTAQQITTDLGYSEKESLRI
jgi:DNA-binding IclR family transcriptional regulator